MKDNREFDYEKYKGSDLLLERFVSWYVGRAKKEKCLPMKTIQNNCKVLSEEEIKNKFTDRITILTLYKQEDLQVQLYVLPPNTSAYWHTHPNMDSFEVYIGGDMFFEVYGYDTSEVYDKLRNFDKLSLEEQEKFHNKMYLSIQKINPKQMHCVNIEGKGGALLSIQRWLDWDPSEKNENKPTNRPDVDWGFPPEGSALIMNSSSDEMRESFKKAVTIDDKGNVKIISKNKKRKK
jgi:hypothetical protein